MNTTRTAILVGATGLVGREILRQLLDDPRFSAVTVLTRRSVGVVHDRQGRQGRQGRQDKLVEHIIDFDRVESWQALARGDVLFSGLGTTRKAAGSQDAQYKVDYTYQLQVAQACRKNGSDTYVLVSSAGASANSQIFYSRMKGELERDTAALGFARTRFLHPGPLDGDRQERRRGEAWMLRLLRPLAPILPAMARPIEASIVARAGIAAAFDPRPGVLRYAPAELFRVGAAAT